MNGKKMRHLKIRKSRRDIYETRYIITKSIQKQRKGERDTSVTRLSDCRTRQPDCLNKRERGIFTRAEIEPGCLRAARSRLKGRECYRIPYAPYAEALIATTDRTIAPRPLPRALLPRTRRVSSRVSSRGVTAIDRSHVGPRPRCMFHCARLFFHGPFLFSTVTAESNRE